MIRYVPSYILDAHEHKIYRGSFSGYVLFFDIADFTNLSNAYRSKGKQGAEALNQYLEAVLSQPIGQVESSGGFITHFAGDAFCAVFPEADSAVVKQVVDSIKDHFAIRDSVSTDIGESPIKVRMTICSGTIYWRIFRNEMQCEYVFYGKPFEQMKDLAHRKEDVAMSPEVEQAFTQPGISHTAEQSWSFPFSAETANAYVHPRLRNEKPENEIRDAAYCFVDLSEIADANQEAVLTLIHAKLDDYSGFLNKLDASDKGLVALIIFGLPKAIGNTLERTCRFALEIVTEIPQLRFGIACGNTYAGYVGKENTCEYTALGAAVNLASRLMQKARMGEILTDSYLRQEVQSKYSFAAAEVFNLKGFTSAVHSNRLVDRLPKSLQRFHTDFMGRNAEINDLHQAVNQPRSGITYVSGEPGMGKSRLIMETLKAYPKHYFMYCDPSGHRILEPIKQFVSQYFGTNPLWSKKRNIEQFQRQWKELAGEDKELIRIESIIAAFLGYEWDKSIWSILPPEERPDQQKNAFAAFVNRISSQKKLIIHLDDPQWIDSSSQGFLQNLGAKNIDNVCILAACRYHDDGTPVDLEIPNWITTHVELKPLLSESATSMIQHLINSDSLPQESLEWIINKADGNPLFLEQVVAYLKENDCFDAEYRLVGNLEYLSSFGIADIIGSRIDSLTEHVRNTLQHACVLGLEFNTHILSEMLSRRLDQDMDEGKQARIWADLDELRYIFTHVLIKDTAYNRMMSEKLKKIHLLAAEAMERLYQNDEKLLNEHAEGIAIHFDKAGLEEKAAKYYNKAGVHYQGTYKFAEAEKAFLRGLDIVDRLLGVDHIDSAEFISNLGSLNKGLAKFDQAELFFNRALAIYRIKFGEEHPTTVMAMIKLATVYDDKGVYDKAETIYLRSLEILNKTVGLDHVDTSECLNNLAFLYENQGKYEHAEPLYQQALSIRTKVLGDQHSETIITLNNYASLLVTLGKYEQAEPMFQHALTVCEKNRGTQHLDTARSLNNIAVLYYNQGKYEEVEHYFQKSLVIMEKILGLEHNDTLTLVNNLAVLCEAQGKYDKAEQLIKKTLAARESIFGKEHLCIALSLDNLSTIYRSQGKYDQAETVIKRSLEIKEKALGADHIEVSNTINNLASVFQGQGKLEQAELLFQRALSIDEKTVGADHKNTALSISNLANLYTMQGKYDLAETLNLRALAIREKQLGLDHPDTAVSLHNLAFLYSKQGKNEQVESLYLQALAIREKTLGIDHPQYCLFLNNLGVFYAKQDRLSEAETLLVKTVPVLQRVVGLHHKDTQQAIRSLVIVYDKLNQPDKADEYRAMLKEPELA